jgi:hypothetical protein
MATCAVGEMWNAGARALRCAQLAAGDERRRPHACLLRRATLRDEGGERHGAPRAGADWTPASAGVFRATDVNSLVVIGTDAGPPTSQVSIVVHGVTGVGTYDVEPGCDYVRNDDSTFSVSNGSVSAGTLTLQGFTYTDDGVLNDCFRGSFDVTFTNGGATKHVRGAFDLSKLPAL